MLEDPEVTRIREIVRNEVSHIVSKLEALEKRVNGIGSMNVVYRSPAQPVMATDMLALVDMKIESATSLKLKRLWVYRLPKEGDPLKTYEIGYKCDPPSEYRKDYPDAWCDYRVCEGFWGDEQMVKMVVTLLNKFELEQI